MRGEGVCVVHKLGEAGDVVAPALGVGGAASVSHRVERVYREAGGHQTAEDCSAEAREAVVKPSALTCVRRLRSSIHSMRHVLARTVRVSAHVVAVAVDEDDDGGWRAGRLPRLTVQLQSRDAHQLAHHRLHPQHSARWESRRKLRALDRNLATRRRQRRRRPK